MANAETLEAVHTHTHTHTHTGNLINNIIKYRVRTMYFRRI